MLAALRKVEGMAKLCCRGCPVFSVGQCLSRRANFSNFRATVLGYSQPRTETIDDGVNSSQLPGFLGVILSGKTNKELSVQILGYFVGNIELYPKLGEVNIA